MKAMVSKFAWSLTALGAIVVGGNLVAEEPAPGAISLDVAQLFAAERAASAGPNGGAQEVPSVEDPKELPWGGYDAKSGGFFLQSADGNFRLNVTLRIQFRYTYFAKDEQGESSTGDLGNARDESYFELARARFGFSGHLLSPRLTYSINIQTSTDDSDKGALYEAWVRYRHREWLAITGGQFKPFFLRQEHTSSSKQQRVERSLANEFFNIDRNIGIWVDGYLFNRRLYYNAALTNGIDSVNQASGGGATSNILDQNPACVGKLDWMILGSNHEYSYEESDIKNLDSPLLVIGGSFVTEDYARSLGTGSGTSTATAGFVDAQGVVYGFGVDAIFKYRGFSLSGEYMGRWYDQNGPVTAVTPPAVPRTDALYAHGFNIQSGIFVLRNPDLELTGRVSTIYGNEGPEDGKAIEVGPGINWFFSKSHRNKLQLDVAWVDISNDLPSQTELLRQGPNKNFETTSAGFSEGEQGVLTRVQLQLHF